MCVNLDTQIKEAQLASELKQEESLVFQKIQLEY